MATVAHLNEAHRRELQAALEHYPNDAEEDRLLRELPPRFQKAKRVDRKEDFLQVVNWKAPRAIGHARKNRPEKIRAVTQNAFRMAAEGRVVEAVEALRSPALKGVQTRVATAILTFYDPDRYTPLDWRAWRSLVQLLVLEAFECWFDDPEDYPMYLEACRSLAAWFRHTLRDTDRALWQLASDRDGEEEGDS